MAHNRSRNPAAGTGKVFAFSLRQMLCAKGWLISTFLIAALLLIGIPLMLLAVSAASDDTDKEETKTEIRTVYVVDETAGEADYNLLNAEDDTRTYIPCTSMDAAISRSNEQNDAVILRVTQPDGIYSLTVYLTQITDISRSKASTLANDIQYRFSAVLMQKAELTPEGVLLLSMPVHTETAALSTEGGAETEDDSLAAALIGMMVPFMMMMLIYMMVVLYGQSMANSVMLEKTSKLMETILTAVHPVALMAGKLLATATAAVIQILIWLFALIGGTAGGALFALRMIPETDNGTVLAINEVAEQAAAISIPGVLVSLLIVALGFLLYLSLSAVAGAMASKTEDLNKTNVIFVLVLVVSLLLCLSPPDVDAGTENISIISDALWLKFFPFTSILVMPGALVLGKASVALTCGSVAVLIASVVLFVVLAAVIYKMLVLYRGAPPTPKVLLAMLKEARKSKQPEDTSSAGKGML